MEKIKSRVKERINLMFERKEYESTDSEDEEEEDDEEEDQRKRIRYTNLGHRSMSHSLAPPMRTCSPPPAMMAFPKTGMNNSVSKHGVSPDVTTGQSAAARAFNFLRRKSDPRGMSQGRMLSHEEVARSQRLQHQQQLKVPFIVHRRRSSIAMTK